MGVIHIALYLGESDLIEEEEYNKRLSSLGIVLCRNYLKELRSRVIHGMDLSFSIYMYEEYLCCSSITFHLCHSPLASSCPVCQLYRKL